MKVPELKNDPMVIYWLQRAKAKQNTQESYLVGLQFYTEFTSMTPKELIEEAENEIDTHVRARKQKINQYMSDFRLWLEAKGKPEYIEMIEKKGWLESKSWLNFEEWFKSKCLAPFTIESRVRSAKSFYKYSGIVYQELERRNCNPIPLESNKGIPDKNEIREILKVCDPLEKAIVLVGASSGLASNEIINLKIKNFKNSYCEEDRITTLKLCRQKTNFYFVTFLSPEASEAVWDYLKYRNRTSRAIDPKTRHLRELKRKESSDEGYLFISKYINNEYLKTHDEELRKLSNDAVQNIYRTLCEDTGLSAKVGNWNNVRSHKLRKWFSNKLREAKCDPDFREYMMGHKIEGSKASYFVDDEKELKEAYKNCIPYLTIQKELDISESEDFKRIKAEHETLLIEAEKHRVERSELQELRAELEAEKTGKEAHDAELIERALKLFEANQQKKIEFVREPLTDEQIDELNKPENQMFDVPMDSGLHDLEISPEDLPEDDIDVVKRSLKPEKKG
jgi:integrase